MSSPSRTSAAAESPWKALRPRISFVDAIRGPDTGLEFGLSLVHKTLPMQIPGVRKIAACAAPRLPGRAIQAASEPAHRPPSRSDPVSAGDGCVNQLSDRSAPPLARLTRYQATIGARELVRVRDRRHARNHGLSLITHAALICAIQKLCLAGETIERVCGSLRLRIERTNSRPRQCWVSKLEITRTKQIQQRRQQEPS